MITFSMRGASIAALFSVAALLAVVANALPGDAIYIKKTPQINMSTIPGAIAKAAQREKLGHPAAMVASLVSYRVIRYGGSVIMADGSEERTASEDEWFKRRLKGKAGKYGE